MPESVVAGPSNRVLPHELPASLRDAGPTRTSITSVPATSRPTTSAASTRQLVRIAGT